MQLLELFFPPTVVEKHVLHLIHQLSVLRFPHRITEEILSEATFPQVEGTPSHHMTRFVTA